MDLTDDEYNAGPALKYRKIEAKAIPNGNMLPNNEFVTREMAERLGIPKRWMYCPPMGKEICGFMPTKTPLSQLYDACLPDPQFRFYPADVFKYAPSRCNNPNAKIGMWIDLTKTNRYYQKHEVESRGVKFVKMALAGHGESPSREDVSRFIACVKDFRKDNADDLIVVHCTHGFNRTGFLICAYMYQENGDAMEFAVQSFAAARPNGIYKDDYLRDLSLMYSTDEQLVCPGRPEWENEMNPPLDFASWKGSQEDYSKNGAGNQQGKNRSASQATSQKALGKPQFMDGQVPNVTLIEDKDTVDYLRSTIREYCNFKRDIFPGSQPVSLERTAEHDNLVYLSQEEYMVSWKADGMRYLVLIKDQDQIYAFDRDNNVFEIEGVSFPHRKHDRHVRDTLVDAEMIIEHIPEINGEPARVRPRLLIYDIVKFEDTQVGECNFRVRGECINHELIKPRAKAIAEGKIFPNKEPMGIRRKDFYPIFVTAKLFGEKFTNNVCHEIDGLIFQPVKGGYVPGRYGKLLKWKPQDQSSIDFKLKIEVDSGPGKIPEYFGNLYVMNLTQPFGRMKVKKSDLQYNGKIVECKFENGNWKVMRERTDKSFPNAFETAKSVYRCILSPITKDFLLQFIESLRLNKP